MTPPLLTSANIGSAQSMYTFPAASVQHSGSKSTPKEVERNQQSGTSTLSDSSTSKAIAPPILSSPLDPTRPQFICSSIISEAASYFIHRRIVFCTLAIPLSLLAIPPAMVAFLIFIAHLASFHSGTPQNIYAIAAISVTVLSLTRFLVYCGRTAVCRHAPNQNARDKALLQSQYALPFWSLVISTIATRIILAILIPSFNSFFATERNYQHSSTQGWYPSHYELLSTTFLWTSKTAQLFIRPMLGWTLMSFLITFRYIDIFSPIFRCSCTPTEIHPFDVKMSRFRNNFSSKTKFLDMIANGLDRLASPSAINVSIVNSEIKSHVLQQSTYTAALNIGKVNEDSMKHSVCPSFASSSCTRFNHPSFTAIILQSLLNLFGAHLYTDAILLPYFENLGVINKSDTTSVRMLWLSSLLAILYPVLSDVIHAELQYSHYSSFITAVTRSIFNTDQLLRAMSIDVANEMKHSFVSIVAAHTIAALATAIMAGEIRSLPSFFFSWIISFIHVAILIGIIVLQGVFSRWIICAPGTDADILMHKMFASKKMRNNFLVEDLFVQSLLMGDGTTVNEVTNPIVAKPTALGFKSLQDEEILKNEKAIVSFAYWIQNFSGLWRGKLQDDLLRMCLLESLGGGGSTSFDPTITNYRNCKKDRHAVSVCKRLDLSKATAYPGRQPIVVPLIRALCVFAGGLGESITRCFRQEQKDRIVIMNESTRVWTLPPGSLNAGEYAILGAARLVSMSFQRTNSADRSRSHEQLSLLLPCILQSAFKLRCGIVEYVLAVSKSNDRILLSTEGSSELEDRLWPYIEENCPELCPVISACDDSAKMVMRTLRRFGDESVLLRGSWKGEMHKWLVLLNSQTTGTDVIN